MISTYSQNSPLCIPLPGSVIKQRSSARIRVARIIPFAGVTHAHQPQSEQELLARAYAMAGFTLAQLAATADIAVPADLRRDKGWVGQLISGSWGQRRQQARTGLPGSRHRTQDDPHRSSGQTAGDDLRLRGTADRCQRPAVGTINVRNKLSRVLWIPVEGSREIPIGERRIGMPLLWSPNEEEERLLRQDWEELMDMIVLGEVEQISARHGQVLQLRPKAANNKALTGPSAAMANRS